LYRSPLTIMAQTIRRLLRCAVGATPCLVSDDRRGLLIGLGMAVIGRTSPFQPMICTRKGA
jgi:hypothetical protein